MGYVTYNGEKFECAKVVKCSQDCYVKLYDENDECIVCFDQIDGSKSIEELFTLKDLEWTETTSSLYKMHIDKNGKISNVSKASKKDITALGIPAQDTTYDVASETFDGLMSSTDKKKLDGIDPGANKTVVDSSLSSSSTNPVQNKVINTALNNKVDKDGKKVLSTNDFDNKYKDKLDGIEPKAEVNQNTFSNIKTGNNTISSNNKTDTFSIEAGSNVTIIPDGANKKITISAKDTVYTHPTHTPKDSGLYKITVDNQGHVSDVTAVQKSDITSLGIPGEDTNTVYTHPAYTSRSSGLYKITVDNQGHVSDATAVTKSDITALGIPGEDTNTVYTHPAYTSRSSGLYKITVDNQGHVSDAIEVTKEDITDLGIPAQDTTYSDATISNSGLMSSADKDKLDKITSYVSKVNGKSGDVTLTYTDVNALSKDTKIPTKVSELTNDKGYLTKHQSLADYALKTDLDDKQDKLTFDTTPTASSTNPVTSNGVYAALSNKASLTHPHSASDINSGTLSEDILPVIPIIKGGTGAENAIDALKNLTILKSTGGVIIGIGEKLYTRFGCSLGNNAKSFDGVAIGDEARTNNGASIGYNTKSYNGFAAGAGAWVGELDSDGNYIEVDKSGKADGAAIGAVAYTTQGGAVGSNAKSGSGFAGGENASVHKVNDDDSITYSSGGAVGANSRATSGGAVGTGATETDGGFAGGKSAGIFTSKGGSEYFTSSGASVGSESYSSKGGAVGTNAKSGSGFAGGENSLVGDVDEEGYIITLGSGAAIGNGAQSITGAATGTNAKSGSGFAGGNSAFVGNVIDHDIYALGSGAAVGDESKVLGSTINACDYTYDSSKYAMTESFKTYTLEAIGFAGGDSAKATSGGAVGNGAEETGGGFAGGNGAKVQNYTGSSSGRLYHGTGGAVGRKAITHTGGAVGNSAFSYNGFAGGENAVSYADYAVQLGDGLNYSSSTLQYLDYKIADGSGYLYGTSSTVKGRDMAEYFEWVDGNPNNEDRRGYFVTLDGNKIIFANTDDQYILGVVSASDIASFIGNSAPHEWQDKWKTDIYGGFIYKEKTIPALIDENGVILRPEEIVKERILNPDYDPTKYYIPRSERKEWGVVCFHGQIVVNDDGTPLVNDFCTITTGGIATAATETSKHKYRVLERLDENHIRILYR